MPLINPAPGRIRKVWKTDFDDAPTLPGWLTFGTTGADTGSSLSASAEPAGGVELKTDAVATDPTTATLYASTVTTGTSATKWANAVQLTFAWHQPQTTLYGCEFGFEAVDAGVTARWMIGDDYTTLTARSASGDVTEDVNFNVYLYPHRWIVSMLWTATDGGVYLGETDAVQAFHRFGATDLAPGAVVPFIRVIATSSVKRVHVHQMSVERWWL